MKNPSNYKASTSLADVANLYFQDAVRMFFFLLFLGSY